MNAVERLQAVVREMNEKALLDRSSQGVAAEMEHFIAQANDARRDYEDARRDYITSAKEEAKLEAERPVKLAEIKKRLMAESATLAATPAEQQAKVHPEYLNYLALQRETVAQKDNHRTSAKSAWLRGKITIAALKAMGGLT